MTATRSYLLLAPMAHLRGTVFDMPVTNEARTKTGIAGKKQPNAGIRLRIKPARRTHCYYGDWRL